MQGDFSLFPFIYGGQATIPENDSAVLANNAQLNNTDVATANSIPVETGKRVLTHRPTHQREDRQVLFQQGRVFRDSDLNEQGALTLHYLYTLGRDLIGPWAGPAGDVGYKIVPLSFAENTSKNAPMDFEILPGRYYVEGVLCELPGTTTLQMQPDYPHSMSLNVKAGRYLAYLDVWHRHVTALESAELGEVALGMAGETCSRVRLMAQVKVQELQTNEFNEVDCVNFTNEPNRTVWNRYKAQWQPINRGFMQATTKESGNDEACLAPPNARYRGPENQLYRVEIHRGTSVGVEKVPAATLKWSRENGSVLFTIGTLNDNGKTDSDTVVTLHLTDFAPGSRFSLEEGDVVEVFSRAMAKRGEPGALLRITSAKEEDGTVTASLLPGESESYTILKADDKLDTADNQRLLRRWDHVPFEGNSAIPIFPNREIEIEDGILVKFAANNPSFRSGDFWLIPARTATGSILWHTENGTNAFLPPQGVEHVYAPLAILTAFENGRIEVNSYLQRALPTTVQCAFPTENRDTATTVATTEKPKSIGKP